MMLGEESESALYWRKAGDEAIANGIKGVVMMGAHWDAANDKIEVAMNPDPGKSPVAYVHPSKYENYKLNPDLENGERILKMLQDAGFNASANEKFDWIHDTYLILIRMFPGGCPPTVLISMNAMYGKLPVPTSSAKVSVSFLESECVQSTNCWRIVTDVKTKIRTTI